MTDTSESNDINGTAATVESEVEAKPTEEIDSKEQEGELTAAEEVAQEIEEDPNDGRQWYILQVFTGQESSVKLRIDAMVEVKGFQDYVFRVLVPEEETIEIKDNKRVEKTTKMYPGYVFVQLKLNDDVFYNLRNLAGVAKFIGTKTEPTPVTDDEILKVLRKIGDKTRKVDVDFEVDEVIKVIGGPFRGYSGPISEINGEKGKLKALISIFGRETPVELDFDQVEKVIK